MKEHFLVREGINTGQSASLADVHANGRQSDRLTDVFLLKLFFHFYIILTFKVIFSRIPCYFANLSPTLFSLFNLLAYISSRLSLSIELIQILL